MPDSVFGHLAPHGNLKFLCWVLVRHVVEVEARFVCELELSIDKMSISQIKKRAPRSTHQYNPLRCLICRTCFQKERPQLDRTSKRDANDSKYWDGSGISIWSGSRKSHNCSSASDSRYYVVSTSIEVYNGRFFCGGVPLVRSYARATV